MNLSIILKINIYMLDRVLHGSGYLYPQILLQVNSKSKKIYPQFNVAMEKWSITVSLLSILSFMWKK